jgi:hypothetical protein
MRKETSKPRRVARRWGGGAGSQEGRKGWVVDLRTSDVVTARTPMGRRANRRGRPGAPVSHSASTARPALCTVRVEGDVYNTVCVSSAKRHLSVPPTLHPLGKRREVQAVRRGWWDPMPGTPRAVVVLNDTPVRSSAASSGTGTNRTARGRLPTLRTSINPDSTCGSPPVSTAQLGSICASATRWN